MFKFLTIVFFIFIAVSSACGTNVSSQAETQQSSPQSAATFEATILPEQIPSIVVSATPDSKNAVGQKIFTPPELKVVYLKEGNLWLWTAAGDNVMLTGTGDITTARLSNDGQYLAFMRGPEVWTIRMDGTDARLHITQEIGGGALRFAPNGSLLAVSTIDHIDVIDLGNAITKEVLSYPPTSSSYYPEVVWASDSTGFKTVLPPNSEIGQAEFLFVFTSGTRASLAKISMVVPSDSLSFISPDGGYVIYVAKLADSKESLFLLDSSGATKRYGEPARSVRAYGWQPDSKHFAFSLDEPQRTLIGNVTGFPPMEILDLEYELIRWVDAEKFLAIQGKNLYFGDVYGENYLIAEGVSIFDFGN